MSTYNTKNYTEQGGETTHFGGKVIFEQGCTVEGLSANPLQAATTSTLGGVKAAAKQADSTATTVAELVTDFNALLAKLIASGAMSGT